MFHDLKFAITDELTMMEMVSLIVKQRSIVQMILYVDEQQRDEQQRDEQQHDEQQHDEQQHDEQQHDEQQRDEQQNDEQQHDDRREITVKIYS